MNQDAMYPSSVRVMICHSCRMEVYVQVYGMTKSQVALKEENFICRICLEKTISSTRFKRKPL
jgi:hypothetical protein